MYISTKGRYALRLMLDLAENAEAEQNIPLKKVAERQQISLKYLEQIITALCKAGFIKSIRGSQGGYRLAHEPEYYTVAMILRLTEGTLAPVSCLEDEVNQCPRSAQCATLFVWQKLYDSINDTLESITLKDIVDNKIALDSTAADDYVI
ncbi:transcriptional regulator, BadM/Rrf2 family [Ruminococcus sp. YE71]|uniref:RrF2 family transcriptional regulator n=1 Tax=unclassified Ruminococcus TaxID=2608920 RepID=UPI000890C1AB|nr:MULTISPECIES: Rrf2 family transcriptional regulator [unclassified Ruminococcus]SDA18931.1 transcriptional regulator, BadM/Rrf2 family [Ruminococcus sp. YE78]SFW28969.1 transcriptional regulator, BadM/Rrf2 family [Ruminococcus sp. YE71]